MIINAAAARRYWPDDDPIGRRIDVTFADPPRWYQIVGIVGDVKHAGLEQDTDPEAYMPHEQAPYSGQARRLTVVVRTRTPLATMAPMLKNAVTEIDRNQPVGHDPDDGGSHRRVGGAAASEPVAGRRVRGRRARPDGGRAVRRDVVSGRAADARDRRADGARRLARASSR